jgi:hypothetical protein
MVMTGTMPLKPTMGTRKGVTISPPPKPLIAPNTELAIAPRNNRIAWIGSRAMVSAGR